MQKSCASIISGPERESRRNRGGEQLGLVKSAVVAAPQAKIELGRSGLFGHDPEHEKIERIEERAMYLVFVVQAFNRFLKGVQNHTNKPRAPAFAARGDNRLMRRIVDPVQMISMCRSGHR
jgi:hypothetical protein